MHSAAPGIRKIPRETLNLAANLAHYRRALADHYSPETHNARRPIERYLDAALLYDQSWLVGMRLAHLRPGIDPAWGRTARARTLACYRKLNKHPSQSPIEQHFVAFRLAALSAQAESDALSQSTRQAEALFFHDRPAPRSAEPQARPVDEQKLIAFGAEIWMALLGAVGDYQALVQTGGRILRTRNGEADWLPGRLHKRLGLAWWDYARELGDNGYGTLAWQNALHHFALGDAMAPLERLQWPF
jgi:hypothetical protein